MKSFNEADDLLMDLEAALSEHEVAVDITIQFGVNTRRIKPTGNLMYRQITNETCPRCGKCRLNTDGEIVWCSYIFCDYIGRIK